MEEWEYPDTALSTCPVPPKEVWGLRNIGEFYPSGIKPQQKRPNHSTMI